MEAFNCFPARRDERGNVNNIIVIGEAANVRPYVQHQQKVRVSTNDKSFTLWEGIFNNSTDEVWLVGLEGQHVYLGLDQWWQIERDMMSTSGAGRYMAFPPSPSAPPSPHLSGLRSTPLSDPDKSYDGTGFDVNGRCGGGVLVDDGLD
ncbi:hypothetical protein JHK85_009957 [Glycine max]|nr:hypothetical protein JHK85_009957 [Glycine max]